MEVLKQLVLSLLIAGGLWCGATALMLLMCMGSPASFRPLFVLRRTLATVPSGSVFHLRNNQLVVTAYNAREDREISVPLFRAGRLSLLRWRSAAGKSKSTLRRRVDLEISCRLAALVLFTVPGLTACLWLAMTSNWLWVYAVAFLVAQQVIFAATGVFYFLKLAIYSALTGYLFLHRVGWWHPSLEVSVSIAFGWAMISVVGLAALAWNERRPKPRPSAG